MFTTFDTSKIMNNLPIFEKAVDEYDISKVSTAFYGRELACLGLLERTLITAVEDNPRQSERLEPLIIKVMTVGMVLQVKAYEKCHM